MREAHGHPRNHPEPEEKLVLLATAATGLWTFSAVLLLILLRLMHSDAPELFGTLDVDLPGLTQAALAAADFVSSTTGLLLSAGALALTLTPFLLGARGRAAAKVYFALTFLAVLGIATIWFAANQPLTHLRDKLDTPSVPFGR